MTPLAQHTNQSRRRLLRSGRNLAALAAIAPLWSRATVGCGDAVDGESLLPVVGASGSAPDSGFVQIPANSSFKFVKASTSDSANALVINAFALAKTHVTNAQYKQFTDDTARTTSQLPSLWRQNGNTYPAGKANHPVLWVSKNDAEAYCVWLTEKYPGWQIRLPSEPEWELAARGPNSSAYPWGTTSGNSFNGGVLNTRFCYNGVCAAYYLASFGTTTALMNGTPMLVNQILAISASGRVSGWNDNSDTTGFAHTDLYAALVAAGGYTQEVGSYANGASAYGCFDMAGNAYEWTSSTITATNGAESGATAFAIRGGSWYAHDSSCSSTARGEGRSANGGYHSVGFRVAASAV